jgi:ornithine carbamoyltransferase
MADLLRMGDLSPGELHDVLARSAAVKRDPESVAGRLRGVRVGLFFMKPSTRTRVSAEVATLELGGHPVVLRNEEVGLGTREAPEDVARVLDRYLDLLALRVFAQRDLDVLADYARVPVVNLLSELEHPCQALADLQTIAEVRPLSGTVLAYLGDGNNVCHSLMVAAVMTGMEMRVATPPGHEPAPEYRNLAGEVVVTHDPEEAVKGAHVVYTDVWASMGQETEVEERRRAFRPYQVDLARFELADPAAIFLHCLPAHRGEEVTAEVMEHERSHVFDQAENRLHAFKALLLHLLE